VQLRKSKAALTLLGLGLVAGIFTTGGASAYAATTITATATPTSTSHVGLILRPDASGETVCLLNASQWCADVKGNSNTAGTSVWLENNGADDQWIVKPDPSCTQGGCYYIEDAQNTALCMSATGTNGAHVNLAKCSESGSWYNRGNNDVGNAFYGEAGDLYTNAAGAGYYLYAGTGQWQRWSIPGLN
jgi:hypothetical protein